MPIPAGEDNAPPSGAYAAAEDLVGVVDPVPDNADRLLVLAAREIDRALLCAVYDTADADVIAALKAANIEQVVGMLASGDTSGLGITTSTPSGFTIGKLSVQQAAVGPAPTTGRLYDQAYEVLQLAGLTGGGPGEPGWPV